MKRNYLFLGVLLLLFASAGINAQTQVINETPDQKQLRLNREKELRTQIERRLQPNNPSPFSSPEQDCSSAIPVCQNVYNQPTSYSGYGNTQEVPSSSCLASQEKNSVWYIFTVTTGGSLIFQITPVSSSDDYDFAVYNITGNSCSGVSNGSAPEVNCNYSATAGNTGLQTGQTNTSQNASGTNQNAPMNVTVGQTYVLVVSNYSSTQSGYTLDFSGGTASIFDNVPPAPQSVFAPCGQSSLTLQMTEAVTCASIAANASDFTLTGPGGPFTVSSAAGGNCGASSSQITLNFSPALQVGQTYTLTVNTGTDGNTLIDNCLNPAVVGSNVTFSVSNPAASISGSSSVCSGSSVGLTASNGTAWSWSPGGFTTQTITVSPTTNTTYSVTVTNGTCGTSSATHPVTVTQSPQANFSVSPSLTVCAGTAVTFNNTSTYPCSTGGLGLNICTCGTLFCNNTSNQGTFVTYLWTFGDGGVDFYVGGSPSSAFSPTYTYNTPGTYDVSLNASGLINTCSNTEVHTITVLPAAGPISATTNTTTVCPGDNATLTASGGSSYTWTGPAGFTSTLNPVTVTPTVTSTYTVTSPGCSGNNTATVSVTVATATITTPPISGSATVCPNATSVSYSIAPTAGATYTWTASSGATIASGQGTNVITADFGASGGVLSVNESITCGTGTPATLTVTANTTPPATGAVSGPTTICPNQTGVTYSVTATAGSSYNWSVPSGASIVSGQGTNSITVDFGATAGTVSVTETNTCGIAGTPVNTTVGLSAGPTTSAISGPATICPNQTNVTYSVTNTAGSSYSWTIPSGASFVSGQGTNSITVNFGATAGTISVTETNSCSIAGSSVSYTVGLSSGPVTAAITGPTVVCPNATGVTYSVTNTAGSTYNWTVPAGATVATGQGTNSITVDFGGSGGTISVTETNACGISGTAVNTTVSLTPGPITSAMTGPTSVCPNATAVTYSVSNTSGSTYNWTVPAGATIVSGQGTNVITVDFGTNNGTVSVTETDACNVAGTPVNTTVTLIALPVTPAISGPASVCPNTANVTYSVTNTPPDTYNWTVPAGAAIVSGQGTNSVAITFGATGGTIGVTESSSCGAGTTTTLAVVTSTSPATPVISGPATVCESATAITYSVTNTPGNTYNWTVPTGATLASGQTTNSIVVNFGTTAGNISVTETSTCGTSPSGTLSVAFNFVPTSSAITGASPVCANSTGNIYSVSGTAGDGYTWTVPTGATITSGQNTSSITVDFGSTGGTISLTESNTCGNGTPVTLSVTVNAPPVTPSITGNTNVCANTTGEMYSVPSNAGNTYTWSSSGGATITSSTNTNSITADFATTPGTLTVTESNSCGSASVSITVTPVQLTVIANPASASICPGYSATLNASGAASYLWSPTTGLNVTTGSAVVASPTLTTTYTVTGTTGSCSGDTTIVVTVTPPLAISLSAQSASICSGSNTTVTASGASTYTWSPSTGLSATTGSVVTANPSGTVTYTVVGTTPTCAGMDTITLTVNNIPPVNLTPSSVTICEGDSIQITASGATSYNWSPNSNLIFLNANQSTVSVFPPVSTNYVVIGTTNGCTNNATLFVTVIPAIVADAGPNDTICIGESVTLSGSGGNTFSWQPSGSLSSPLAATTTATPVSTTTYTVTTSVSGQCAESDYVTVVVNALPLVSAGNDTTINFEDAAHLSGFSSAGNYLWSNTGLSCDTCPDPVATPTVTTSYTLATQNSYGCAASDTVTVFVSYDYAIYAPNSFTPNDDGINDIWRAEGFGITKFTLYIYDRWGNEIYRSSDMDAGWNGTYKGKQVQMDVYVYKIDFEAYYVGKKHAVGRINLVR